MGRLVDGIWHVSSVITSDSMCSYDRLPRTFLETISSSHSLYRPEANRYHLYVSYACPWATRTLIYRQLKGLADYISVDVVHPDMGDDGWIFDDTFEGSSRDSLHGFKFLRQVYLEADPLASTSVTVPILWDKKTGSIVNNESSQIIRIFNSAFNDLTGNTDDFYPSSLRREIDDLNEKIYQTVNNGVYKTGFATNQESYDEAVTSLFDTLDELDQRLTNSKYLLGDEITEADLRLIPTLLRFDVVYFTHFKCNWKRIVDYKNLHRYMLDLYSVPAIKDTCHLDHMKRHYYFSHRGINPQRIIPKGPQKIF